MFILLYFPAVGFLICIMIICNDKFMNNTLKYNVAVLFPDRATVSIFNTCCRRTS